MAVPIRIVIGEDNHLFREGLSRLLMAQEDIDVVGAAADLPALERVVRELDPDVVVSDIRMPPTATDEGVQLALRMRTEFPRMGVVLLSQFAEPDYALELLDGGAAGRAYLLKDRVTDTAQLVSAIREVARGGSVVDPSVVDLLIQSRRRTGTSPVSTLTPREHEVLALLAQGRNNGSIAAALLVTERSVEKHVNSIFSKLQLSEETQVHRRVRAALLYLAEG